MKTPKLIFILILGLILRLINLNQSLWLDEAAQALESARPLRDQFSIIADFHPPLYHLLLHFWMILGASEIWIRIPSVVFGVGSIYLLYQIAQKLEYKKSSLISSFFLAVSPFAVWYSQEARPYELFAFLCLLSTYFLLRKNWFFYVISSILALYTNYFAPFLFLSQAVYIITIDRKEFKKYIVSLFFITLSFIPWFPSFINQLKVGTSGIFKGWTEVVSVDAVKVIPLTLAKFVFGKGSIDNNLLYFLVISPVLIIFAYSFFILLKNKKYWPPFIFFLTPLIFVAFATTIVPVAAPQRLLFILPFFALILALGIQNLEKYERIFCVLIITATFSIGLLQYYTDPNVQREKWRQAVSYIDRAKDSKSLALFVFPTPFAPFQWYQNGYVRGIGIAPSFIISDEDLQNLKQEVKDKDRLYLFQYLTGLTDPENKVLNTLLHSGYKQIEIKNYEGVGFIYVLKKT